MSDNDSTRLAIAVERVARILGALYAVNLGKMDVGVKEERLKRCGFSNAEIADLLGTTEGTVKVARSRMRSGKKRKRTKNKHHQKR